MFRFRVRRLFNSKDLDYYQVLGVMNNAKRIEIRNAYLKLAKVYHPDTPTGNTEKFKRINEAWSVLGDEKKRQEYDLNRNVKRQNGFWDMGKEENRGYREENLNRDFNVFGKGTVKHEIFKRVLNMEVVQQVILKHPWKFTAFCIFMILAMGILVFFDSEEKFLDGPSYGYYRRDDEIIKRNREKRYFEDDYD